MFCPVRHHTILASETVSKRPRFSSFAIFDAAPSHCDSASEVASYFAESVIKLRSDPLMFWKNNSIRFP